MDIDKAKKMGLELMETADAAFLSTVDDKGYPQTRAMLNLRMQERYAGLSALFDGHDDDSLVYFTTHTASRKISHIRQNPRVCVYYCNSGEYRSLMLGGEIEVVTDAGIKNSVWQKGWEMYYPIGVNDPNHTVLRLLPSYAIYYHALDNASWDFM